MPPRLLPRWHVALPLVLAGAWGALLPVIATSDVHGPLVHAKAAAAAALIGFVVGALVGATVQPGVASTVRALRLLALAGLCAATLLALALVLRQAVPLPEAVAWAAGGFGLTLLGGVAILPHGARASSASHRVEGPASTATLRELLVEPLAATILGGGALLVAYLVGYVARIQTNLLIDGQLAAVGAPGFALQPSWPHPGIGALIMAAALVLLALGTTLYLTWRSVLPTRREFERLRRAVDGLSQRDGLARPIRAEGDDELATLGQALEQLRRHFGPALAEYQQAAAQAEAADRDRTAFLGVVTNALRVPLDKIVAGAEALVEPSTPLSTEQREDVRIVLSSSRHLTDLIDEVLDISVIASGQVHLKLASFDLTTLITEVAKAQRPLVQRKNVELRLTIAPDIHVRADERRVRQVLTNLCSNATKFTETGCIEVGASVTGSTVDVYVRDTGPGIAEDAISRLFTAFVQLGTLKQRAYGTGLGLAICKRLVEAHGGGITVESTVGVGSLFRFSLPLNGPETSLPGVVLDPPPSVSGVMAPQ